MKVSIIGGGGLVGSSAAYALQCGGVVRSLCLIDANQEAARGHATELLHWARKVRADQAPRYAGFASSLGLAQYRAGRYAEAVRTLEEARAAESTPTLQIFCLLVEAMAHQRLNEGDKARSGLQQAEKMIQERQKLAPTGKLPHTPPGAAWHEWAAIQILLEEARSVVAP